MQKLANRAAAEPARRPDLPCRGPPTCARRQRHGVASVCPGTLVCQELLASGDGAARFWDPVISQPVGPVQADARLKANVNGWRSSNPIGVRRLERLAYRRPP
jgi:hypothetical protein